MKRKLLIGLAAVLALAVIYCGWRYVQDVYLPNREISQALEAQDALFQRVRPAALEGVRQSGGEAEAAPVNSESDPTEPSAPENQSPAEVDPTEAGPLGELLAYNGDTVAWLLIPGTSVDYPVVQAEDNNHYLRTGFDGTYNFIGCPFLDCRCDSGFEDFSSIVYGHYLRRRQGEMFADLVKYKDPDYLLAHRTGALLTREGLRELHFFAYLSVPGASPVYETRLMTRAEREEFLDLLFETALYTRDYTVEDLKARPNLRLILLSTCSYEFEEARAVLVGVIE